MVNAFKKTENRPNMTLPFDQSTNVQDIMVNWPQTVPVFLKHQMSCIGCYVGPFHTIADACFEHNIDEQLFWKELAVAMASDPKSQLR